MDEDDAVKKQRRLTDEQRGRAEAALPLVPAAVRAFASRHPCYARILRHLDLTSVAQMALKNGDYSLLQPACMAVVDLGAEFYRAHFQRSA